MIHAASLTEAIRSAAMRQAAALSVWYPQAGDNAPAERNYTLHLAAALAARFPRLVVFGEPNILDDTRQRLDLAAFDPDTATLIAVEAKRFLETESVAQILSDIPRIRSFFLRNSNGAVPEVRAKWGMLLTSSIREDHVQWWRSPVDAPPGNIQDGSTWGQLASHLRSSKVAGGDFGAEKVDTYPRYLLWAFWPEPVSP